MKTFWTSYVVMEFQIKPTVTGVDQDGRDTTKHLLERLKRNKQNLTIPSAEEYTEQPQV